MPAQVTFALALAFYAPPAPMKVVTTTQDLASIAQAVGGSGVMVSSLVVGARDPHRIEAKPSFMSRVARADMFIAVGLDLEVGYESLVLQGSRNRRVMIGQPGHLYAHEGGVRVLERPINPVTRAQGDVHPQGNPHYWLDPWNAKAIAKTIAERMAKLNPQGAQGYRSNAAEFSRQIDARMFGEQLVESIGAEKLWAWDNRGELLSQLRQRGDEGKVGGWVGRLARHRGAAILTYHRTWTYFADRFGLRIVGELEPKPGLEPTPGHLRQVQEVGRREGVKVILQEPFYSTRPSKFVGSRIGAQIVIAPGSVGQLPAAKDYFAMIDLVVGRVAQALGS